MKLTLDTDTKQIELSCLFPGTLFLWDGHLWFYQSKDVQHLAGVGEKVKLKPTTLVWQVAAPIAIDGVRAWIRNEHKWNVRARKAMEPLERLILMNEQQDET